MSGLDKMKAQIIAEAQDNAKEILAQAHAQADSIIGEAKAQAEKDARKIVAQAEARAEDSVKRLASSSDMRKRKAVLEAKQEGSEKFLKMLTKQSESLMMQLILQCLKRFLRSMYFRKKEPSALQRKTENVCLKGIWKKYMKQRRRKAEAWNLQRQCRKEWMGDLS